MSNSSGSSFGDTGDTPPLDATGSDSSTAERRCTVSGVAAELVDVAIVTGTASRTRGASRTNGIASADACATAKRDLRAGEMLDGEGGYTVYGRLMPASASLGIGALPIGLAHGVKLLRPVAHDSVVRFDDVAIDGTSLAVRMRREMEAGYKVRAA